MMGYDYVTQYSKRDFIDVIRLLESWLRVNQKEYYEWAWCNHVIPLSQGLDVGDRSHIGSVRRPCEGATEQGTQFLQADRCPQTQPAKEQDPQSFSLKELNSATNLNDLGRRSWASSEMAVHTDTFISAMWDPKESLTFLTHRNCQIIINGCFFFKPLHLW